MSKHTPGPFRFVQASRWPFELSIYATNPDGPLISVPMPAHTSSDMTQEEALSAINFPKKDREEAAAMNAEMVANFHLWSAAPDLLEACKAAEKWLDGWASAEPYLTVIREAIAKAEGSS